MIKRRKIQIPNGTAELNLSDRFFDDEQEELEAIDANEPSKLKKLFLNNARIGPKNAEKLFKFQDNYNFEIFCSNNSQISNLATHLAYNTTWTCLKIIHLNNSSLRDEDIIKIAQNSTWTELRILRLSKNLIGDEGAIALGRNKTWRNLRILDLSYNQIEHDGAVGLAENSTWSELTELDLQYNLIDDESAFALGRNSAWKRLERRMVVKGNTGVNPTRKLLFAINSKVSTEFNQELEESKETDIETLISAKEAQFKGYYEQLLTGCRDERREELARIWDAREKFGTISFDDNGIQDRDKESHLMWTPRLECLKLAGFVLSPEGSERISRTAFWTNLQNIDLSRTRLGDNGISIIAKNTTWKNLRSIDVSINSISDEGCLSLAQNSSWKLLQNLNLSENNITNGIYSLSNNQNWKNIKRIELFSSHIPIEELALFFENHDAFALPHVEVEAKKRAYCLNLKYSRKLSILDLTDDFEGKINGMNEEFQKELNQLTNCSQSRQLDLWKGLLKERHRHRISQSIFISEGFDRENSYLLWFPDAKVLDLKGLRDKYLVDLLQKSLSWINVEEVYLGKNSLTDADLWKFGEIRNLRKLRKLALSHNEITDEGALHLLKTTYWKSLEVLDLRNNKIKGYKTVLLLAGNENWPNLNRLRVSKNRITEERLNALQYYPQTKMTYCEIE